MTRDAEGMKDENPPLHLFDLSSQQRKGGCKVKTQEIKGRGQNRDPQMERCWRVAQSLPQPGSLRSTGWSWGGGRGQQWGPSQAQKWVGAAQIGVPGKPAFCGCQHTLGPIFPSHGQHAQSLIGKFPLTSASGFPLSMSLF